MNIDISKLPRLDCIAAKLYDKIIALNKEHQDFFNEDELIEVLNNEQAQIKGKIKRNAHSFILLFSDDSCLRVDCFTDEQGMSVDMYVGQYSANNSGKLEEINTEIPLQPSSNSVN